MEELKKRDKILEYFELRNHSDNRERYLYSLVKLSWIEIKYKDNHNILITKLVQQRAKMKQIGDVKKLILRTFTTEKVGNCNNPRNFNKSD